MGERLTALSGLVLMLSAFMGWYAGSDEGPTIAVIGWHTGVIGKLVFLLGLAVVVLVVLRELGHRAAGDGSGEPRDHRARLARDDPRPRPADLRPRPLLPLRRARDRDLDRAHCGVGPDRRRASTSRRRAVATASPTSAPADHVERIVHAVVDAGEGDQRGENEERAVLGSGVSQRERGGAGEARRGVPRGKAAAVRHRHERMRLGEVERRAVASDRLAQRVRGDVGDAGRRASRRGRSPGASRGAPPARR